MVSSRWRASCSGAPFDAGHDSPHEAGVSLSVRGAIGLPVPAGRYARRMATGASTGAARRHAGDRPTPSLTRRLAISVALVLLAGGGRRRRRGARLRPAAAQRAYDRLLIGAADQIAGAVSVRGGEIVVDIPASAFELLALAPEDRVIYAVFDPAGGARHRHTTASARPTTPLRQRRLRRRAGPAGARSPASSPSATSPARSTSSSARPPAPATRSPREIARSALLVVGTRSGC